MLPTYNNGCTNSPLSLFVCAHTKDITLTTSFAAAPDKTNNKCRSFSDVLFSWFAFPNDHYCREIDGCLSAEHFYTHCLENFIYFITEKGAPRKNWVSQINLRFNSEQADEQAKVETLRRQFF